MEASNRVMSDMGIRVEPAREQFIQRQLALEAQLREQRELVEGLVHDLRNPLTILCGELEWMGGRVLSLADLTEALALATRAATRIGAMLGDLLAASSIEQAGIPPRRKLISLNALVSVTLASFERRFEMQRVVLAPLPDDDVQVAVDPALLRRVLENLMDNALRHTPPGGRIAVQVRSRAGAEVIVSNDGPIIAFGERERIFQKFRRGSAETPGGDHFGLGLYFCRRIIEAHGGAIRVEDFDGWPTSMVITLP